MRKPQFDSSWPETWKLSFRYDEQEFFGPVTLLGYHNAYSRRFRETIDLVKSAAAVPARILDVAAAQGNFSLALAELGYDVTWNDLRGDLIDYIELKRESGDLSYAAGNVFDLGFHDDFDVVVITEIIEHVAHPDQFLAKIATLVRPGGYVVMTTPNGNYFRWRLPKFSECSDPSIFEAQQFQPNSDGHIFLIHSSELNALSEQAGLELVRLRLFTNPLTNGHIGLHKMLPYVSASMVDSVEAFTEALPMSIQRKIHSGMAVLFRRTARPTS